MWTFEQSTGKMYDNNGRLLAVGYAGRNEGLNNPAMENVKGVGPLPQGIYTGVEMFAQHPVVGKFAIHLSPDHETAGRILGYGRDPNSFFFHGDSSEHPGLASHGCIVEWLAIRKKFWSLPAEDRKIQVVAAVQRA